jgi:hypothetical protein
MRSKAYLAANAAVIVMLAAASIFAPAAIADEAVIPQRVAWIAPPSANSAGLSANLHFVTDKREVFNGCTMDQIRSMKSSTCISKADDDLMNNRPLTHIVVCKGTEIVCCLQDDHQKYSKCEAMGGMAPPAPDVVCSTLSSAKGLWQPDPRSIKAASDKHNCTQTYTCTPPLPKDLSASQNKCNAVVSVSNKQVTQNGTCEPGNGSCTTCRTNPPNDPCVVTFRK